MLTDLAADRDFLLRHHTDEAEHSGASLLDHLLGTEALLRRWGAPAHVCRAGLYHSVYGTEAYPRATIPRSAVAERVGARAEELVYLFGALQRDSLHANAGRSEGFSAVDRASGARVELSAEQLHDLILLSAANWLEQQPRLEPALGRARRAQYQALLPHLPPAPRAALREALGRVLAGDPSAAPTSLCALLAFDDAALIDATCGQLDVRYLQATSADLLGRLAAPLRERVDALPDDAYLSLLRSPATCAHLAGAGAGSLERYLEGALQIEEWRAGRRAQLDVDAWSADAALYLPAGTATRPEELLPALAASAATAGAAFDARAPYLAPRLGGWVVADLYSPEVGKPLAQLSYKATPFGPAEPMTAEDRDHVLTKLGDAFDGLAQSCPDARRFLRYTLTTVIPRKQTRPDLYPSSFKGSSTAATLHRANLYNAQFRNVDAARVAQSILHETVHNHLYKRERFQPTLIDVAAGEALRVTSPWSGNTLDLYVFAHSTTVYYALFHFFDRLLQQPDVALQLPRPTAAWFRDRAVRGFADPRWTSTTQAHRELFAPAMYEDLQAMRERVLSSGRRQEAA
ncbi:MAG: hypothetical protein R3B48_19830 [Kofleriaceae bacterium]